MLGLIFFGLVSLSGIFPVYHLIAKNLLQFRNWQKLDEILSQELSTQSHAIQNIFSANLALGVLRNSCRSLLPYPPALAAAQSSAALLVVHQQWQMGILANSRIKLALKQFKISIGQNFQREISKNLCLIPGDLKLKALTSNFSLRDLKAKSPANKQSIIASYIHRTEFAGAQSMVASQKSHWHFYYANPITETLPKGLPR